MSRSRGKVVITSLFDLSVSEINSRVEYPGICGACVEKTSYELRWVSHEHLRNVSIVLEVILNDMSLNFFSGFINWAVSNIIDHTCLFGLAS